MKKTLVSLAAVAALSVCLVACGESGQESDPKPSPTRTATPTRTPSPSPTPTTATPSPVETEPSEAPTQALLPTEEGDEPEPEVVYYANCSEVRAAGAAPIRKGQPGYSSKLDRDGDGVACDN